MLPRSAHSGRILMDSSRQRQEMTLGGVLGRWTLSGDSAVLA